jgi:DNA-directed RNA polymerase specialized sigma24 family protein
VPATPLPLACHSGDEEEKGKKEGKEQNGQDATSPSLTEFQAHCCTLSVLPAEAEDLWHKCEQRGWKDGGGVAITNWKAYCNRMAKYVIEDRHKRKLSTKSDVQEQPVDRTKMDRFYAEVAK